jgi:hypothetical protein
VKTYPIVDDTGTTYAFEIEKAYIARSTVASVLASIDGVTPVRRSKAFRTSREVSVMFSFRGSNYIVWEPFGDSSRYWIGPDEVPAVKVDIGEVEAAFRRHKPSRYRRLLGDLVTFRLLTISGGQAICRLNSSDAETPHMNVGRIYRWPEGTSHRYGRMISQPLDPRSGR